MAIVVEDYSSGSQINGDDSTALTLSLTSAPDSGDVLVLVANSGVDASRYISTPTGWTSQCNVIDGDSARHLQVMTRYCDGNEGSSFDFVPAARYVSLHGILYRLSGAEDPGTTFDGVETDTAAYLSGTVTCPTVTVSEDGSLLFCVVSTNRPDSATTEPTGFSSAVNEDYINAATDGVDSGASGTNDWTDFANWWSVNDVVAGTFAVAPASGGGGVTVDCTLGAVTISGNDCTITAGTTIDCTAGAITVAGNDATVSAGTDVNCTTGALVVAGNDCTVSAGTTINCTAGAITIAGNNVDVDVSLNIDCTAGAVVISGNDVSVSAGTTISCTAGAVVISGNDVTVSPTTQINCTLGAIVLAALKADVQATTTVSLSVGAVTIAGHDVSITTGATTVPDGVDYRATDGRPHYRATDGRPHYKAEDGRPHYRA